MSVQDETIFARWAGLLGNPDLRTPVGIAGDWHGDTAWGVQAIERFAQKGIHLILHCGDFNIWTPGSMGDFYLARISTALDDADSFLMVTLGNHEDYDRIEGFPEVPGLPGTVYPPGHPRILIPSRGYRWEWNKKTFISVSGGATVDRMHRVLGESYWEQELLTDDEVDLIVKGGRADIMISHDAPVDVDVVGSHRSGSMVESFTRPQRERMKTVFDAVRPSLHFFGHYHVSYDQVNVLRVRGENEYYQARNICMDKEFSDGNMGILDLETFGFKRI